jgi:hypothetical protein
MRSIEPSSEGLKSQIIAHRGFWFAEHGFESFEPNSFNAIKRASELGFGLETDLRDYGTSIAIEHDPFEEATLFFEDISHLNFKGPVCLNIKADGLGARIKSLNKWENSFYFDLSIPEMIKYLDLGLTVADRISEYEYMKAAHQSWIWIDTFKEDWWLKDESIRKLISEEHKVIVVSPELHGREYLNAWEFLKPIFQESENLHLCTDFPVTAYEYMVS